MRGRRSLFRAVVAAGVLTMAGGLLVGLPTASASEVSADSAADPSSVLPPQAGVTMPVGVQEAAGDVLGKGYDQVVRLNGTSVEIAEPAARGGKVMQSFTVGDLKTIPIVEDWWHYYGMNALAKITGHQVSRIAVAGDFIYVSTMLPPDSPWIGRSIVLKYNTDGGLENSRILKNGRIVTALDAYKYGDKTYLALGLNTTGVRVVDADAQGMHDVRVVHEDWDGRAAAFRDRDMVTAVKLATDDDGRFILLAGKITDEHPAVVASDTGISTDTNAVKIWEKNYRALFTPWEWPNFFSTGPFGPDGKQMAAISWVTAGQVALVDLATGGDWHTTSQGTPAGGVKFFTDAQGEPRVAIHRGVATIGGLDGSGRYEQVAEIPEEHTLQLAVPGYRAWSLEMGNETAEDVTLQPYTGATRDTGCWWGSDLRASSAPMPSSRLTIPAGGTVGPYGTAQRLQGQECNAADAGTFYVRVAPVKRPEQAEIIKLLGDGAGLRVDQQVGGGRFTLKTEREGAYGVKLVVTERFDAPSPDGSPTLAAARLTPKPADNYKPTAGLDDPTRPVYRFTVSGQNWQVPGADQLSNVTLPSPTAEGSVDGITWTALGTTTSPLKPSRQGTAITLGDSTFYWQTIPGGPDYRYYRVTLPDGTTSNTIDVVTDTTPPEPRPGTVYLSTLGEAVVRPNSLDQAAVQISIRNQNSAALDPVEHAAMYDRLYFRDDTTNALLTGLGNPERPGQLTMVTRARGQFGDSAGEGAGAYGGAYLSTNDVQPGRLVKILFKPDGTTATTFSYDMSLNTIPTSLFASGDGSGIALPEACVEGVCEIAKPTPDAPILHSLDERSVTLQLAARAIPGTLSLPLSQVDPRLVSDTLVFTPTGKATKAALAYPQNFAQSLATITTHLVTHGELITAANLYARPRS